MSVTWYIATDGTVMIIDWNIARQVKSPIGMAINMDIITCKISINVTDETKRHSVFRTPSIF